MYSQESSTTVKVNHKQPGSKNHSWLNPKEYNSLYSLTENLDCVGNMKLQGGHFII